MNIYEMIKNHMICIGFDQVIRLVSYVCVRILTPDSGIYISYHVTTVIDAHCGSAIFSPSFAFFMNATKSNSYSIMEEDYNNEHLSNLFQVIE